MHGGRRCQNARGFLFDYKGGLKYKGNRSFPINIQRKLKRMVFRLTDKGDQGFHQKRMKQKVFLLSKRRKLEVVLFTYRDHGQY